jgi:hypothetical protein
MGISIRDLWARDTGKELLRLDCWDGSAVLRRYYKALGFLELERAPEGEYWVRLFEKSVVARSINEPCADA